MALALLGWGLGHVATGDRRGWLLLASEAAAIALLIGVGLPRIEGDAFTGLFLALVLFFAVWATQAVLAYGRAERIGAAPGGAIWLLALLPVTVVFFSLFWMLGGSSATASATTERYVDAWKQDQPQIADRLLAEAAGPAALAARWVAADAAIGRRLAELSASLGPRSGLDLGDQFANLEFRQTWVATESGWPVALVHIVLVRHVSVRSSFLGLFPTAVQQTDVLDEVGTLTLDAVPLPGLGFIDWPTTHVWRITAIHLAP